MTQEDLNDLLAKWPSPEARLQHEERAGMSDTSLPPTQHQRDSAELRALCQARDDARRERDRQQAISAELYKIVARLAAPVEGLINANSSAENAAIRLAEEARDVVAKLKGEQS